MAHTLMASFKDSDHADMAVTELEKMGYTTKDISVISHENRYIRKSGQTPADAAAEGAGEGAVTGGVIGGLAGLLAGVGVIPALAGLFIGGPIALALGLTGAAATAVSGAVTGATAGGLIGALAGLGVPEETARVYDETVKAGGVVIGVPVTEEQSDHARGILQKHEAMDITEVDLK